MFGDKLMGNQPMQGMSDQMQQQPQSQDEGQEMAMLQQINAKLDQVLQLVAQDAQSDQTEQGGVAQNGQG